MKLMKGIDGHFNGSISLDEMEADFISKALEYAAEHLTVCSDHLQMMEELSYQFDTLSRHLIMETTSPPTEWHGIDENLSLN